MASARPKLWLTTSRIQIINIVTFLMLSAVAVATESNSTHQCYWCGPIAELVHRSEIAPPCGQHNTVVFHCQEGHNYCAIAASTPPYVESRFCSKVYQDECYQQYCNTTKKWRMTCTCRGDLCNENITKRETDAFAKLPGVVEAQDSREKRETNNAKFILSDEKTVITNSSPEHNDQHEPSTTEHDSHDIQTDVPEPKVNIHIIYNDEDIVTNTPTIDKAVTKDIMKNDEYKENNDSNEDTESGEKIKANPKNEITATSIRAVLLSKVIIGTTTITKSKEDLMNTNTRRPSERLPSAEALQQEASSENDHDNTDHTTVDYEPTDSGTSDGDDDENHVTTEPNPPRGASDHIYSIDVLLLLNGMLLLFMYDGK